MKSDGSTRSLTRSRMREGGPRSLADIGSDAIANVPANERGRATEPLFDKEMDMPRSLSSPMRRGHIPRSRSVTNETDNK